MSHRAFPALLVGGWSWVEELRKGGWWQSSQMRTTFLLHFRRFPNSQSLPEMWSVTIISPHVALEVNPKFSVEGWRRGVRVGKVESRRDRPSKGACWGKGRRELAAGEVGGGGDERNVFTLCHSWIGGGGKIHCESYKKRRGRGESRKRALALCAARITSSLAVLGGPVWTKWQLFTVRVGVRFQEPQLA